MQLLKRKVPLTDQFPISIGEVPSGADDQIEGRCATVVDPLEDGLNEFLGGQAEQRLVLGPATLVCVRLKATNVAVFDPQDETRPGRKPWVLSMAL